MFKTLSEAWDSWLAHVGKPTGEIEKVEIETEICEAAFYAGAASFYRICLANSITIESAEKKTDEMLAELDRFFGVIRMRGIVRQSERH